MENYYNQLSSSQQKIQIGKCRFMDSSEFKNGVSILKNKNIVIVGCGAQGLNQGLNMRDSGLNISYALRQSAIDEKRDSFLNVSSNKFKFGTFSKVIPDADMVINLTPDKNHTQVINQILPLMKKNTILSYSHGFNIVEEGMNIREDITVIMVAPKCPGTEVREEFLRGFGVPTLIAVHPENDLNGNGLDYAKAYAVATGGHRAGVLESSFVAEVKSDLMGEQTILCGILQTGSILCFNKMIELGYQRGYSSKLVQYGWETLTEELKHNGISGMMNKLKDSSRLLAHELSNELKLIMTPLFENHMNDILNGNFSKNMMKDWENDDFNLLKWRKETGLTDFEKTPASQINITNEEFFEKGILMIALIKSGVELAFETMVSNGIIDESAYYESLHELPLIANLVARKKLYEMNRIISDTAEYGCYLFNQSCLTLLSDFMTNINETHIGKEFNDRIINSDLLSKYDNETKNHRIEKIGVKLRKSMNNMIKLK